MDCRADFDLKGIEKMIKTLDKMGKSSQKAVSKAANAGGTAAKKAYSSAPVPVGKTGNLLRAVKSVKKKRHQFKRRQRGVAMYDIAWPEEMDDVFQKPIKNPGVAGGKSDHAYYPNSVEYGFLTRAKGGGIKFVPGQNIIRKKMDAEEPGITAKIVQKAEKELDKLWKEAEHK